MKFLIEEKDISVDLMWNTRDFVFKKWIHKVEFYELRANIIINLTKYIIEFHNGIVPSTYKELRKVPGMRDELINKFLDIYSGVPESIEADSFVHRTANRIGWV